MDNFVYINKYSLSHSLCNEIIEMFEKNKNIQVEGHTGGGLNKDVKDTTDLMIPLTLNCIEKIDIHTNRWIKIYNFLIDEIFKNMDIYLKKDIAHVLEKREKKVYSIQIQRYEKNKGKYIWHNDARIEKQSSRYRVITFLWYLNDVHEGGETGFVNYSVKPETGKLLFFPSDWSYPHRGNVPISNDKYIMTGWVYVNI